MQFLRRPRDREKLKRYGPLVVLGCFVLVLVAFQIQVPRVVQNSLSSLASGMLGVGNHTVATVDVAVRSLSSEEDLVREIVMLRDALSKEKRKSFRTDLLERENESLRALLGRGSMSSTTLHAATVLARPAQTPYDTMLVDQGLVDGIITGSLVLVQDGIVLGYVADARSRSSLVRLFSSPGEEHAVLLTASTTVVATVEGIGNGSFKMRVPRDVGVAVGDPISLQVLAPYLLATASYTETDEVDAFTTAYFTAPVAQSELRSVLIDTDTVWHTVQEFIDDTGGAQ